MKYLLFIIVLLTYCNYGAQTTAGSALQGTSPSGVLDGVYVQEHIPTKKVISYPHLREADVMWSKRVWRMVDLREKFNFPLYYPVEPLNDRRSLWDVIKYGVVNEGSLIPYLTQSTGEDGGFDDQGQFLFPVKPPNGNIQDSAYKSIIERLFFRIQEIELIDEETGDKLYDENGIAQIKIIKKPLPSTDVVTYKIKEDWFFDKQRSVMDKRIIGIAPGIQVYEEDGVTLKPALDYPFWLYFPECRYVFQNYFVYNRQNDAQRMSFDDLFWKRMFSSYIYKESNVYDREIADFERDGVRALLNSEKIKSEIFKIEHDLWHL